MHMFILILHSVSSNFHASKCIVCVTLEPTAISFLILAVNSVILQSVKSLKIE
jgi:hypothetical protein